MSQPPVCPRCGEKAVDRALEMRRTFALLHQLGISDDERRELAMMLPTQQGATGPVSFRTLSGSELRLLADWLTGADKLLELAKLRVAKKDGVPV